MGGRAGLRVGPGFGHAPSGTAPCEKKYTFAICDCSCLKDVALLRLSCTPVQAFAILKKTNAEYKLDTVLLPQTETVLLPQTERRCCLIEAV